MPGWFTNFSFPNLCDHQSTLSSNDGNECSDDVADTTR